MATHSSLIKLTFSDQNEIDALRFSVKFNYFVVHIVFGINKVYVWVDNNVLTDQCKL